MLQEPHLRLRAVTFASLLLASTSAAPLLAQAVVTGTQTDPLRTSVDGDITIQSPADGEEDDTLLEVTGATPIVIDSNNSVTVEENATVQADDADNRVGIEIESGTNFDLNNAGNIRVTEDFVAEDEDLNSIADGPIAEATNRYGVRILPGGTTTGSFVNSGDIYVEGLNSFAVSIEGDYVGTIDNTGDILVAGDGSVAFYAQSIDGDLRLGGSVQSVGEGSRTVLLDGDITGTLRVDGVINNASVFTNENGRSLTLSRSDLRESAPTVEVRGDVAGGILIDARPFDLDPDVADEDGDGVDDIDETNGRITTNGEAPALLIGSDQDIEIGTVVGRDTTASIVIDGSVNSSSIYSSFDSNALVIGGQGGTVNLPGGIGVSGSVSAQTIDSTAVALLINEGVTAETLDNSGSITASLTSSGEGTVIAVRDLSGTLTTINNSGFISANGSNEDTTIAIDLSRNTTGVTITQFLNDLDADTQAELEADEDFDADNPAIFASISGDIITTDADDLFDVQTGLVRGDAFLGGGNDTVLLSDDAQYFGDIFAGAGDFTFELSDDSSFRGTVNAAGNDATVRISDNALYLGTFEEADNLDVIVEGGTLEAPQGETLTFDTLEVQSGGILAVTIDGEDDSQSGFVVNEATFADGSLVSADVQSITGAEGSYTVLTAGTLTGTPDLDFAGEVLPLLFTGELNTTDTEITLDLRRKTAEELGLTAPQSAGYDAFINAALETPLLEQSFLDVESEAELQQQFEGLLPDYAGGPFDFVSRASRQFSKQLSDGKGFFDISPVGGWLEPVYFTGSKDTGDTAEFTTDGWGLSGGIERDFGFGRVGIGLGYATGSVTNTDRQDISSSLFELSGHWRVQSGNFNAFARVSGIRPSFSSTRTFTGELGESEFTYTALGDWEGWAASAMGGMSYNLELSKAFSLRPKAAVDYFWLQEDGYQEDGADEIELLVEDRTSTAATATASMALSYRLGRQRRDNTPLTIELEGGWRSVLIDDLGNTTSSFLEADTFTVGPEALSDGWVSEARIKVGGMDYLWQLGIGAEQIQGDVDLSARFSLTVAL